MSYLGRVWMAASVAVVQSHTDQGVKWNAGVMRSSKRWFSGEGLAGVRPFAGVLDLDLDFAPARSGGEERRKQTDDSLRKAMAGNTIFLNMVIEIQALASFGSGGS
ncbi:hypothetical protein Sjap_025473 [Stephania japonica]|uniref:Uncharacterized protein n=1 Tax=Stephania japonica TaxID=461633 RepID=A0AAP0HHK7_9MAGN